MQKVLKIAGVLVLLAFVSAPQGFSQVEVFTGYSRLQFNRNLPNLRNIGSAGADGWEGSLYLHLLGPFGAVADFSNHYGISPSSTGGFVPGFTDLFGPRFTLHIGGVEPFAHALFGTVHGVASTSGTNGAIFGCPTVGCAGTVTDDAFGTALGGGLNIKASRHLWLRLVQADYLRVNFHNNTQNDARISAGLVFRFGQW